MISKLKYDLHLQDPVVQTSIPLSGYTVVMATEADLMTRDNVLKLFCVAQNKTFYFQAEDRLDLRR